MKRQLTIDLFNWNVLGRGSISSRRNVVLSKSDMSWLRHLGQIQYILQLQLRFIYKCFIFNCNGLLIIMYLNTTNKNFTTQKSFKTKIKQNSPCVKDLKFPENLFFKTCLAIEVKMHKLPDQQSNEKQSKRIDRWSKFHHKWPKQTKKKLIK